MHLWEFPIEIDAYELSRKFFKYSIFLFFYFIIGRFITIFSYLSKKSYIEEILLDAIPIMLINNKLKLGKIWVK